MGKIKKFAKLNLFKIIFAVIIIVLLFRSVDLARLKHLFKDINVGWLLLACLLTVLLRIFMTVRLQYILKLNRINVSIKELIKVIFVSMFFGCIFPSAASADVVRGYQLFKSHGNGSVIMGAIILDRFIGLYSMLFLATIGSLAAMYIGISLQIVFLVTALQIFMTIAWFLFCYLVNKKNLFRFSENTKHSKLWSKLSIIMTAVTNVQMIRKAFLFLFAISLLTQINRCALFFCLYASFGSSLNFTYFLVFIPLVFIILMIPLSIGGLGIREASLVYFFETIGITNEISLSAGFLSHFIQIILSLPFVILPLLYVIAARRRNNSVV